MRPRPVAPRASGFSNGGDGDAGSGVSTMQRGSATAVARLQEMGLIPIRAEEAAAHGGVPAGAHESYVSVPPVPVPLVLAVAAYGDGTAAGTREDIVEYAFKMADAFLAEAGRS